MAKLPVDPAQAERLHELMMDLVQAIGVLQLDHTVPDHPITLSQVFALHTLDTDTPLSQQELAERLRLEKSSVSRMATDMERAGLLVRERDPHDRRHYRLRLTDRGRALHRQIGTTFHRRYECWIADMTARERAALLEGLPALVRVVRHQGGRPE